MQRAEDVRELRAYIAELGYEGPTVPRIVVKIEKPQAVEDIDSILDETDAALDESNVGRFRDALRYLTEQTQFILITHNRGTIEGADTLYGVTMGNDGVSRVLSLKLEDAIEAVEEYETVAS